MVNGWRSLLFKISIIIICLSVVMYIALLGAPFKKQITYHDSLGNIAQSTVSLALLKAKGTAELNISLTFVEPVGEYILRFSINGLACNGITYNISVLDAGSWHFANQTSIEFTARIHKPFIGIVIHATVTGPCSMQGEPTVDLSIIPVTG